MVISDCQFAAAMRSAKRDRVIKVGAIGGPEFSRRTTVDTRALIQLNRG